MIERGEGFAADDFRVVADEAIGAFADGHRALGVAAQGQARNAERRRLFLYAAAVGEHQSAVAVELQKIQIAERLGKRQPLHLADAFHQAEFFEPRSRSRMHREDDRQALLNRRHRLDNAGERRAIINVRRAMHGHCRELSGPRLEARENRGLLRPFEAAEQRIDHYIADEANLMRGDAFAL